MKKYLKSGLRVGVGAGVLLVQQVQAAVPASATAAIDTMAADAATVATAVLVAIIGIVAIKFIRKGL